MHRNYSPDHSTVPTKLIEKTEFMIARLEKTTWRSFLVIGIAAVLLTWSPREYELPADTPWHLLIQAENVAGPVVLSDTLRSLEGQSILLTGFMYPLEQGRDQSHFLLSPLPPSCPFHEHGGPPVMVEVFADEAVRYTYEAIAMQGVFELESGENGVQYQLHAATSEDLP